MSDPRDLSGDRLLVSARRTAIVGRRTRPTAKRAKPSTAPPPGTTEPPPVDPQPHASPFPIYGDGRNALTTYPTNTYVVTTLSGTSSGSFPFIWAAWAAGTFEGRVTFSVSGTIAMAGQVDTAVGRKNLFVDGRGANITFTGNTFRHELCHHFAWVNVAHRGGFLGATHDNFTQQECHDFAFVNVSVSNAYGNNISSVGRSSNYTLQDCLFGPNGTGTASQTRVAGDYGSLNYGSPYQENGPGTFYHCGWVAKDQRNPKAAYHADGTSTASPNAYDYLIVGNVTEACNYGISVENGARAVVVGNYTHDQAQAAVVTLTGGTSTTSTASVPSAVLSGMNLSTDPTIHRDIVRSNCGRILPNGSHDTFDTTLLNRISASSPVYSAVFSGDASGNTDVTSALVAFLQSHNNQTIALAPGGIYRVGAAHFTASNMRLDFQGARLIANDETVHGILRLNNSTNITINDPWIIGTGYNWVGVQDPLQEQHAIHINGGSNITINRLISRDVRGDGCYIGNNQGSNLPATGVVINNCDIQRASRNGISPVSGEVSIIGGLINRTGIFGVDFEPNNDQQALSIRGIVRGVEIRNGVNLPGGAQHAGDTWAVAAGGFSTAKKQFITYENCFGDRMGCTIRNTAVATVRNNVSEVNKDCDFPGCDTVVFTGNTNLTQV